MKCEAARFKPCILFEMLHVNLSHFLVYFRVVQVQRVVLVSQGVQDFRGCQGRGAFLDLRAQKEMV